MRSAWHEQASQLHIASSPSRALVDQPTISTASRSVPLNAPSTCARPKLAVSRLMPIPSEEVDGRQEAGRRVGILIDQATQGDADVYRHCLQLSNRCRLLLQTSLAACWRKPTRCCRSNSSTSRTCDGVEWVLQPLALRLLSCVHHSSRHLQGSMRVLSVHLVRGWVGRATPAPIAALSCAVNTCRSMPILPQQPPLSSSSSQRLNASPSLSPHLIVQAAARWVDQENPHRRPPLLQVAAHTRYRAAGACAADKSIHVAARLLPNLLA